MTNAKKKFYITKHCQQRYVERINGGTNPQEKNIIFTVMDSINAGKDITSKIYDEVPRFILHQYERHGKSGLTIMQTGDIIYVCHKRKGTEKLYDVLTCYHAHRHLEQFRNTVLSREDIFLKIKAIKSKLKHS